MPRLTPISVRTGRWIGDCFVYTNTADRLNYLVGEQTYTISHFDSPHYVLGYLPRDGRVYIADKDVQIVSFALSIAVIEYQTLVLRGEMDDANDKLSEIPADQMSKIARFLEGQGHKDLALQVATDPEHRFELALGLGQLDTALELARSADAEHKWKTVGDAALAAWNIVLAQECFLHAKDLGSLLLLYTASCNAQGLRELAAQADEAGQKNVAFSCLWQVGDVGACIDLLVRTGRVAEAVLFAQTYMPSRAPDVVAQWKANLAKGGKTKVARLLGQPPMSTTDTEGAVDAELFPQWDEYLRLEKDGGTGTGMRGKEANLIDVGGDEEQTTAEVTTEDVSSVAASETAAEPASTKEDEDAE